jgi:hypothetical protein
VLALQQVAGGDRGETGEAGTGETEGASHRATMSPRTRFRGVR